MDNKQSVLRHIPQIDEILREEALISLCAEAPRTIVLEAVRAAVQTVRRSILDGSAVDITDKESLKKKIIEETQVQVAVQMQPSLRRVINATGVVLHTNLGRSILSEKAIAAMEGVARGYSNLEFDLEKNSRGSRHSHIEEVITRLTGAEAAMVVNNNAAATMLCLSAMAEGKEVITSRGELIEIGGSFRVPDIMEQSGAKLCEVGTTNKTHLVDYERAYKEGETGALLKVHTSNYRIIGFTEEASLSELKELSLKLDLPLIYDMGSGLFVDLSPYGVDEPTIPEIMKNGADVLMCSGDKLLGGPQAGILVGKKEYIDRMKKHPLARAFRVDKLTIAALTATLYEYFDVEKAEKRVPVLRMISQRPEELKKRADELSEKIAALSSSFKVQTESCKDQVGGGSAPGFYMDGYMTSVSVENVSAQKMEEVLRTEELPILCRISHDSVCIDVRTLQDDEYERIVTAFAHVKEKFGLC